MKLSKLNRVLRAVELLMTTNDRLITTNQIAVAISSAQSRATTYRYVEKAKSLGFITTTVFPDGISNEITPKGYLWMEKYNALKI